jgi:glyoxylase-like metal-dependent hydrolase (beta-lactamase superfamily II)
VKTIVPFVHEGLGNSSYLVGLGSGEALVVDPDRNVGRYLDAARAREWQVVAVLETHLHADFVTGSLEVAAATGTRPWVAAEAGVLFPHRPVRGGESLAVAGAVVDVLASPGHTPEHVSYVVRQRGSPPALFSGGSLIVGGAARTDLISADRVAELTRAQYRTVHQTFRSLPDETQLLPTHGGGSFCSAGVGGERTSTLGDERRSNPVLVERSEAAFARWFPESFPAAPAYFFRMRAINQAGPRLRSAIPPPPLLDPEAFDRVVPSAYIVDTRPQAEFMARHVPGSINIAFRDSFATWLGWLVPADARLLLITGGEPLGRVLDECLLVGYERFTGVLAGGLDAWELAGQPIASAELVGTARAAALIRAGAVALDVRERDEFAAGHIPSAVHIPLGELPARLHELPRDRPVVTYCGHGERSATALSLLAQAGFTHLANLDGGFEAWSEERRAAVAAPGGPSDDR